MVRELQMIPVATLANGHAFELAVHSLRGAEPGPRLGVVAGTHGDEPLTVETVRRLLSEVERLPLRGEVRAIACTNPYALQSLTRNTPVDMANLNRVFPGDPDGTFSEQLAHAIWGQVRGCDALIDFHGSGNDSTVDYVYMHGALELARAFGCEILRDAPAHPGSLSKIATDHGIPTLVSELGGGQQRNTHYLEKGIRGGLNVLKHLDMLDGEPELPSEQTIVEEIVTIAPHHGGLMVSDLDAGDLLRSVPRGTELARIYNPSTLEELEVLHAPFEQSIFVLLRERFSTVDVGDYSFMIANGATGRSV
jgi:predicted deacylase